jgi:integrase
MRGNDDLSVKPADVVGRRRFVRLVPPLGMYRAAVRGMSAELRGDGWGRESAIVDVIEAGGLRVHEGSLLNFRFALRQARRRRCFLVKRGSKGGRAKYIRRLVPVDDVMLDALERGAALQGDRDNLIPEEMTAHQFEQRLRRVWRRYRAKYGLGTPKDLRSAFACRYYEARTGNPAPCLTAGVTASKHADLEARIAVSLILGHSRIDVVAQYVGTRRRAKRENDDG